jgi:hypothetical protein
VCTVCCSEGTSASLFVRQSDCMQRVAAMVVWMEALLWQETECLELGLGLSFWASLALPCLAKIVPGSLFLLIVGLPLH